MIEAILWDNDGVLIDTEALFFRANRDALESIGIELSRDLYVDYALHRGMSCLDLAAERGATATEIDALRARRNRLYAAMLIDAPPPMPGVADTLAVLKGRFRMCVVTTSLREHFDLMHAHSGLRRFFEFVIAREDYANSKPDPEPYLTALIRLDIAADRCVAIEDSERGLASATAAGLRCIVIPGEMTKGASFRGATMILDSAAGLPRLLRDL